MAVEEISLKVLEFNFGTDLNSTHCFACWRIIMFSLLGGRGTALVPAWHLNIRRVLSLSACDIGIGATRSNKDT